MVVSITGLGSVWRRRFGKNPSDPRRFACAAYYNTAGVPVGETIRTRSRIAGYARFDSSTSGFNPNYPQRMINRVFECAEPCVWQGQNKILFKYMLATPRQPDVFLVAVRQTEIGRLHIGESRWKSDDGLLISFSESHDAQECLLLLPAHGWIQTDVGTFRLEPMPARSWTARLLLVG